ncbi:hypothetical protein [Bacillus bingmayongensis]|uniref:hypothetical protein n=1 Tax=Bacillus bingmayongensis TaxID=1150157 RepID=UPI001C8D7076|nr:hypothetical protein [Bacillus bingmayongensis]MBY0597718.1 hypothetical protein [Bacillus bingmayongensis]
MEEERLTEADYEIARRNGIPKKRAWQRVNQLYWDKERAITEPVGKSKYKGGKAKKYGDWPSIAQSNGIHKDTFYYRIKKGMSYQMAATKPPGKQGNRKQVN